jgi:hypothetical protein
MDWKRDFDSKVLYLEACQLLGQQIVTLRISFSDYTVFLLDGQQGRDIYYTFSGDQIIATLSLAVCIRILWNSCRISHVNGC